MALQNSIGYVRLTNVSLGADHKTLSVNWLTFASTNWRDENPKGVFDGILESGMFTFDLAIKEKHGEEEVVIGYLPQSIVQAHLMLKELNVNGAKFADYNFEITGIEIDGVKQEEKAIKSLWRPDLKVLTGQKFQFFDGKEWQDYEVIQSHTTQKDWTPNLTPSLFKLLPNPNSPLVWKVGILVNVNEQYSYNGITYIVIQSHTTQSGWEPNKVPALWKVK